MPDKFLAIRNELAEQFMEREDVIDGMIAGLLTGHHVLLLGPPGTAKSLLARELCGRVIGANYFERLLTKFSVPEELFGPISLAALEKDSYSRVVTNKLPEAHVAFLDEIFKSSSAILNTLLTIINERVFHNDGTIIKVPLLFMVGASNELPEEEALDALYDRFLLRFALDYVTQDDSFRAVLQSEIKPGTTITHEELLEAQKKVVAVKVTKEIIDAILNLRTSLSGLSISDRRWKETLKLIKATAFMAGRTETAIEDALILRHSLWDEPDEISKITATLNQTFFPERAKLMDLYDDAIDAYKDFAGSGDSDKMKVGSEARMKLKDAIKEIKNLALPTADSELRDRQVGELKGLLQKVVEECVVID